jgi:hypothetical protein
MVPKAERRRQRRRAGRHRDEDQAEVGNGNLHNCGDDRHDDPEKCAGVE